MTKNLYKAIFCFVLISNLTKAQTYEAGFQTRVNQLTNRLADTAAIRTISGYFGQEFVGPGSLPDPEKHVWPVAIARFKKYGLNDTAGNRLILKYKDRSPFHFTYVGMARIMSLFANAPQMQANKISYLTRVWQRNDSYNPWTGEGTENHLSMNKTSGYIYAQHSLGNGNFSEAASRLAETKNWLRWYAKRLFKVGNSEWNSSTYESYNLVGWLNLYDFAQDAEVKNLARAVLDYYACELALHCSYGITGGSESRGNATNLGSGADYVSWLWFGEQARKFGPGFWTGKEFSQAMHAATSSYRPPSIAVRIARKDIPVPAYFKNSKPDYGQNKASFVNQFFYVDKDFTLGSAMNPVNGWAGGNSQYCNWKFVGNVSNPAAGSIPQVVTGGSRFYNGQNGRNKTPFDQYVQHKNVVIQLHKIPSNAAQIYNQDTLAFSTPVSGWIDKFKEDFKKRFPNDVAKEINTTVNFMRGDLNRNITYLTFPKTNNNGAAVNFAFQSTILFIELEKTFVAVRSLSLNQPSSPQNEGNTQRSFVADNAQQGQLCGLVSEFANKSDFASFTAFQQAIISGTSYNRSQLAQNKVIYKGLNGDTLVAQFTENGPATEEPLYDWGYGPITQQLFYTSPPFIQPNWLSGIGRGKIPSLTVNGNPVNYGSGIWPVYEGPGFVLKDSTLRLTTDSSGTPIFYQVEFTGSNPIFSSGIVTEAKGLTRAEINTAIIAPNPANEKFFIAGISKQQSIELSIHNLEGKMIRNFPAQYADAEFNVKGITPGMYIVRIQAGSEEVCKKLLVQQSN